jgi:AAA domain
MKLLLDSEQLRVLNWRTNTSDIAALEGPPGCGKTTVGSALAIKLIAEGFAKRVLLVAYTNSAANEFGWELFHILGHSAANICVRTGNPAGVDHTLPIPFSRSIDIILKKRIVISTNLSLKRLPTMRFDNMIIDEAGIERIEHLLWPFWFGVDRQVQAAHRFQYNASTQINDLMELISRCGTVATVVGDPKQSRPISPVNTDYSAIEWVMKRSSWDTLRISHRLPDSLSGLVNEFASYGGLKSAPEIAPRRLTVEVPPDIEYRDIIQPDEVITWVDVNSNERPMGPTSWANELEAKACTKISNHLSKIAPKKTKVIVTRFTAQKHIIRNYLQRIGDYNTKVTTTTGALGTQADIVIFSLVRNNPERNVGAAGTLQDLNVAISRSKEKLIILGNFEMMLNGWTNASSVSHRKSPARNLARLVESKYGKIIDTPKIIAI